MRLHCLRFAVLVLWAISAPAAAADETCQCPIVGGYRLVEGEVVEVIITSDECGDAASESYSELEAYLEFFAAVDSQFTSSRQIFLDEPAPDEPPACEESECTATIRSISSNEAPKRIREACSTTEVESEPELVCCYDAATKKHRVPQDGKCNKAETVKDLDDCIKELDETFICCIDPTGAGYIVKKENCIGGKIEPRAKCEPAPIRL